MKEVRYLRKFKKGFIIVTCVWYTLAIVITIIFSFSHISESQKSDNSSVANAHNEQPITTNLIVSTEDIEHMDTAESIQSPPIENICKLSIDEAVENVLKGSYGNGEERKKALYTLGFTLEEVQEIQETVNKKVQVTKSTPKKSTKSSEKNNYSEI